MKHHATKLTAALSLSLAITSCDNPADQTTDAKVDTQQEVTTASATAESYHFDPSSTINFTGSKVTGSQSGSFKTFNGSFKVDAGTPVSGEFTIDMNSITTSKDKLTGHLKNEDFFNVAKFPEATFSVTQFSKTENGYDLSGNLTMVGITNNITFPATVEQTADTINLTSKFDINRQQWGISYPGRKDDLIRDEFVLELDLTAKKSASE